MTDVVSEGLNYGPIGIARPGSEAPEGMRVRTQRVPLGSSDEIWRRAVDAVSGWAIKKAVRFRVDPDDARVALGRDYDTRFGIGWLRLLEPVRIVWIAEEPDLRGFGYGTRTGHPITGEECFLAERDAEGMVWLVVRTVSRISGGRWLLLWPGIRIMQPYFQRWYARAAVGLATAGENPLQGMRGMRRRMVGEGTSQVDGIARLGYGMQPSRGPFDAPPDEPVELDAAELPWELRGDGDAREPGSDARLS
ncbi:DUF1990 family protein [Homoserinibacter sp. GY 40078]|uniref:DUF1990 family protein n=1 Tax=Homoserinibacter sp. GY 40078 TaxID=2603275 RepID=UPI001650A2BC|nr:DUF1990 domain-containing protein [Homoserinibacter sp. GY 40078]